MSEVDRHSMSDGRQMSWCVGDGRLPDGYLAEYENRFIWKNPVQSKSVSRWSWSSPVPPSGSEANPIHLVRTVQICVHYVGKVYTYTYSFANFLHEHIGRLCCHKSSKTLCVVWTITIFLLIWNREMANFQSSPVQNPLKRWFYNPVQSKSIWTGLDFQSGGLIQPISYSAIWPTLGNVTSIYQDIALKQAMTG